MIKMDQSSYQCISSKNSRMLILFASNIVTYVALCVTEQVTNIAYVNKGGKYV